MYPPAPYSSFLGACLIITMERSGGVESVVGRGQWGEKGRVLPVFATQIKIEKEWRVKTAAQTRRRRGDEAGGSGEGSEEHQSVKHRILHFLTWLLNNFLFWFKRHLSQIRKPTPSSTQLDRQIFIFVAAMFLRMWRKMYISFLLSARSVEGEGRVLGRLFGINLNSYQFNLCVWRCG